MRQFLAISAAVIALPAVALEPLPPPATIAEIFCAARISGDMSPVEPFISDALQVAIADAEAKNDAIQAQHPDDKPPLGDGVPWQSFQDAAPQCTAETSAALSNPVEVTLRYSFPDAPDANWADTLVLNNDGDGFKITDVIYADGSRLTEALVSAFE